MLVAKQDAETWDVELNRFFSLLQLIGYISAHKFVIESSQAEILNPSYSAKTIIQRLTLYNPCLYYAMSNSKEANSYFYNEVLGSSSDIKILCILSIVERLSLFNGPLPETPPQPPYTLHHKSVLFFPILITTTMSTINKIGGRWDNSAESRASVILTALCICDTLSMLSFVARMRAQWLSAVKLGWDELLMAIASVSRWMRLDILVDEIQSESWKKAKFWQVCDVDKRLGCWAIAADNLISSWAFHWLSICIKLFLLWYLGIFQR